MVDSFLPSLRLFFEDRAEAIPGQPNIEELCFVSGREPRLWTNEALRMDMMDSIRKQLALRPEHSLLEVGCAAGFLARELCPICQDYTGIDISPAAVRVAQSLGLSNAEFKIADATEMPFENNSFDRVISYDVFTNFPTFRFAREVMREMLRVVKPGGKVMIGQLADESLEAEFLEVVRRVQQDLDARYGPVKEPVMPSSLLKRFSHWWRKRFHGIEPTIVCYYFNKADFEAFGRTMGVKADIFDIHRENPYFGYRFNVVYTKIS